MLGRMRRSFGADEAFDPTEDLIDATYLVLNDLGAERVTDWARETLATIIEARYVSGWPAMIVTANYAPSALAMRLGHDNTVIGKRIVASAITARSSTARTPQSPTGSTRSSPLPAANDDRLACDWHAPRRPRQRTDAVKLGAMRAGKDGSDGTRTRDLRRDSSVRPWSGWVGGCVW